MKCIYKYRLNSTTTHQIISAPIIKPLHVEDYASYCYLWAVVDTNKDSEEWVVSGVFANNPFADMQERIDVDTYLNTTGADNSSSACHWFCRKYIQGFDL